MNSIEHSPLGKETIYISTYNPELLFPIPRTHNRQKLGINENTPLPFQGLDIWNCYELSWLTSSGKPAVALAEFKIPANSPCIIESKSFKLYLNSFNQTTFDSIDSLRACLVKDLSQAAGKPVDITLIDLLANPLDTQNTFSITQPSGFCIDSLETTIPCYPAPQAKLLQAHLHLPTKTSLYSNLLKSNCPVTGQPDWASLFINYESSHELNPTSLLHYIVSFRQHADFHEHCVERIFIDLCNLLEPTQLEVYARYTRRGGLDINPYRALHAQTHIPNNRLIRQ